MRRLAVIAAVLLAACGGRGPKPGAGGAAGYSVVAAISDSALRAGMADTLDMGSMRRGDVVVRTIGLRNDHTEPIIVMGVETTCGCTTVDYPKRPILPGATEPLTFRFDSKGEKGWQLKSFNVQTSVNAHRYKVYLTGEVD